MKTLIKLAALTLLLTLSSQSQADLMTLSGDGDYNGSVLSDNGWASNNSGAGEVDFWTFSLAQDIKMSVLVTSDIVFGVSLYAGEILTDPEYNFSNYASFDGLFGETLDYVAGSDPFTPLSGNSLSDIMLTAGTYTLALGGNDLGFDMFGEYQYLLNISSQAVADVPEPEMALLMLVGVAGLMLQRKRIS
ncbi:hypothetical protein [Neptunicella sp. SCSIO 80796]|uniref:hypothetical protein n=1 Tax=Neptunicella plasticusilytica TaxID=3117012 RepID=UPI003A4D8513